MLIIESLERYDFFYGDSFLVECPTGSGKKMRLKEVSIELARRLGKLFLKDSTGRRPCHGSDTRYRDDEHWKDLILFYEFFDAEDGRGCGARYVISLDYEDSEKFFIPTVSGAGGGGGGSCMHEYLIRR